MPKVNVKSADAGVRLKDLDTGQFLIAADGAVYCRTEGGAFRFDEPGRSYSIGQGVPDYIRGTVIPAGSVLEITVD